MDIQKVFTVFDLIAALHAQVLKNYFQKKKKKKKM